MYTCIKQGHLQEDEAQSFLRIYPKVMQPYREIHAPETVGKPCVQ